MYRKARLRQPQTIPNTLNQLHYVLQAGQGQLPYCPHDFVRDFVGQIIRALSQKCKILIVRCRYYRKETVIA